MGEKLLQTEQRLLLGNRQTGSLLLQVHVVICPPQQRWSLEDPGPEGAGASGEGSTSKQCRAWRQVCCMGTKATTFSLLWVATPTSPTAEVNIRCAPCSCQFSRDGKGALQA